MNEVNRYLPPGHATRVKEEAVAKPKRKRAKRKNKNAAPVIETADATWTK